MSEKPFYSVNVSAIHNLKAELFRKQEAFKQKNNAANAGKANTLSGYQVAKNNFMKAKSLTKGRNSKSPGQTDPANETAAASEEELSWEKAKIKLAEKEKLYDRLKQAHYSAEGDDDDQYLVDFGRRVQEDKNLKREAVYYPPTENNRQVDYSDDDDESGPNLLPVSPAEEWVEYEDYLGRSRKCLRKDLASILEENQQLARDMSSRLPSATVSVEPPHSPVAPPTGTQYHTEPTGFETEHLEWEKSEKSPEVPSDSEILGAIPVHYQAVRNNEIRNLGVGYYAFSTDEEERQKELENLKIAHEATLRKRAQNDNVKAKRKADQDSRLAKIRERKGLAPVDTKQSEDDIDEFEEFEKSLKPTVEPKPDDLPYVPMPGSREWDRGKAEQSLQDLLPRKTTENFLETTRNERNPDFAPPSSYSAAPASSGARWKRMEGSEKTGTAFSQLPFDYSRDGAAKVQVPAPPESDYQPWDHIRPWKERSVEEVPPLHRVRVDPDRPWTNAPPPSSYGESSSVRMNFHKATEEEIRKVAWELFRNKDG